MLDKAEVVLVAPLGVLGEIEQWEHCLCRCEVPAGLGSSWAGSWSEVPAKTGRQHIREVLWGGFNVSTWFSCWRKAGRIAGDMWSGSSPQAVRYVPGKPQLSPWCFTARTSSSRQEFQAQSPGCEPSMPPPDLDSGMRRSCTTSPTSSLWREAHSVADCSLFRDPSWPQCW